MYSGRLFIVATPIGNLQDITLRAIETLKSCDLIVCEDTRLTGKLLLHYKIKKQLYSLNDFNEETASYIILEQLHDGKNIALVSDAGTPLISDPGYRLVRLAHEHNVSVVPIPGATSPVTALSASGLPSDSFLFIGFLPKSNKKKSKLFEKFNTMLCTKDLCPTLIFFESPHRIIETLKVIKDTIGDCKIVLARELTKVHEEFIYKPISEVLQHYSNKKPKGEFVVLCNLKH